VLTKGGTGWQSPSLHASQNGPFGLCQAESFGNSFADSVSFRFPSWHSLDGHPVPPANCAQGSATPRRKSAATRKIRRGQAAYKPVPLTLRQVQSPATRQRIVTVIDVWWEKNQAASFLAGSTHGNSTNGVHTLHDNPDNGSTFFFASSWKRVLLRVKVGETASEECLSLALFFAHKSVNVDQVTTRRNFRFLRTDGYLMSDNARRVSGICCCPWS